MSTTATSAPTSVASCCQGTKSEWCSRTVVTMRSPRLMLSRPHAYATRFKASVALRTKMTSRSLGALMNRATFARASSNAAVVRSLNLYTPRWMFALCSSKTRDIASITCRGFWLVAALSRYTRGFPRTVCARIGKSLRIRATSSGVSLIVGGLTVTATALRLPRVQGFAHELVTLGLELGGELRAAGAHDAPVDEHVDEVWVHVAKDPLVVRDQEHPHLGRAHRLDALRHGLQRVDVEARVGLVEDREARPEHVHLQNFEALLLPARESVVHRAGDKGVVDSEELHLLREELAELRDGHVVLLDLAGAVGLRRGEPRVDRGAQEVSDRDAGNRGRVLEREKDACTSARVDGQLQEVHAVEEGAAPLDLVLGVAHDRERQRALAGTV